ncbi:hypothetical protein KXD40_005838 [Peronospora effusa]|nr:hypothetical protein KXD40_005838 [Peronospora effusa]
MQDCCICGEQFPHDTRVATLIAVHRESFGEVHVHNWYGCETPCMTAYFLRRNICVIAKGGDSSDGSLYRPSSVERTNSFEAGEQLILTAAEYIHCKPPIQARSPMQKHKLSAKSFYGRGHERRQGP